MTGNKVNWREITLNSENRVIMPSMHACHQCTHAIRMYVWFVYLSYASIYVICVYPSLPIHTPMYMCIDLCQLMNNRGENPTVLNWQSAWGQHQGGWLDVACLNFGFEKGFIVHKVGSWSLHLAHTGLRKGLGEWVRHLGLAYDHLPGSKHRTWVGVTVCAVRGRGQFRVMIRPWAQTKYPDYAKAIITILSWRIYQTQWAQWQGL